MVHTNRNPFCKQKYTYTTILLDTGSQVTMIWGYPTHSENFNNKNGLIEGLGGKLTPGNGYIDFNN